MKSENQGNDNRIKVVLDTNIVVSAALCIDGNPAEVFELVLLEEIKSYTTVDILDEIKKVMARPKIAERIGRVETKFITGNFERLSERIEPDVCLEELEDPDDDKFLECALSAKADYIISGDEHLLKLKDFTGIKIVTPAEFLLLIGSKLRNQ